MWLIHFRQSYNNFTVSKVLILTNLQQYEGRHVFHMTLVAFAVDSYARICLHQDMYRVLR